MLTIHLGSSIVWLSNFFKKSIEIDDFIIPPCSFEIPKKVVLVEISCCPKNEASSKWFIKQIDELTNSLYDMRIKWVTKAVKQLFNLKNIKSHPSCVIYVGTCGSSQTCMVRPEEMLELDGTSMKILKKSRNTSETT